MEYDNIATIYDTMMSHVEYRLWLRLIKKVIAKFSIKKNPQIFEIGGGTGTLCQKLKKNGFSVLTSDLSFNMNKFSYHKKNTPFCADVKNLPIKSYFDFVIFLYDGINYLKTSKEYQKAFFEVHNVLNKDGLFLFDITTKFNSINNFKNIVDYEDHEDMTYIRHSYYNKKDSSQHNDFIVFKKVNNKYEKLYDFHKQYVFDALDIKSFIPNNLFKIEGVWDDFSTQPYNNSSERIHFLLRKI